MTRIGVAPAIAFDPRRRNVPARASAKRSPGFGPHRAVQRDGANHDREDAPNLVRDVVSTPGRPLDAPFRAAMESRMGRDFSSVRVHTDGAAARSAAAIDANAYTIENHIAFATGRFAPSTPSGQRLIAHELAHVVQQSAANGSRAPTVSPSTLNQPGDKFESAADRAADHALASVSPTLHGAAIALAGGLTATRGLVQRQALSVTQQSPQARSAGQAPLTASGQQVPKQPVQKAPVEAWDYVEPMFEQELVDTWYELGSAATRQTNHQIQDFFGQFDKDAAADQKMTDILNITAGGAGNVMQDKLSEYASLTGGIGGAVGQAVQVILAHTLNTNKVADAMKNAGEAAQEIESKEFVRTSPQFREFDKEAKAKLEADFDEWWSWYGWRDRTVTEPDRSVMMQYWREQVRLEYGIDAEPSRRILSDLKQAVAKILTPIAAPLKSALRKRRLVGGLVAGGLSGALIGTAVGAAVASSTARVKGGFIGGLIGLGGGMLLGVAGGWLANRLSKETS